MNLVRKALYQLNLKIDGWFMALTEDWASWLVKFLQYPVSIFERFGVFAKVVKRKLGQEVVFLVSPNDC